MQQWPQGHTLEEWVAFAAVVEYGSFTRAASALGRDATAVSRRVAALERRLGVRLIERTTRRQSLTEAGLRFSARARTLLSSLAEAEDEAATESTDGPRGTLRLSLPATFGRLWIAPLLPEFLLAHPYLSIDAQFSNRFVDLIGEGFDAAVRLGELADSSLVARRIAGRTRLMCAAPSYLARRGRPVTPADLAAHACLGFTGFTTFPDWHFRNSAGQRQSARISGPMTSDDAEALVAAAVNGLGIMMSTDWLVSRELACGKLVPILEDWHSEGEGAIHVIVPSGRFLAAKTRAFRDWITDKFSPEPPWRTGRSCTHESSVISPPVL